MIFADDPGASGGYAIQFDSGKVIAEPHPETREQLIEEVQDAIFGYAEANEKKFAVVEKVHSMPNQGVASSFKFGMQFERSLIVCTFFQMSVDPVTPQKWQKALDIPKRKKTEKQNAWKTRLLEKARSLYPEQFTGLNKGESLKISDALLILEYARRIKR
jgi:hypothetical protein